MSKYNEFLGLCPIGAEVSFNNELKLNGFALSEKFSGRLFFKDKAVSTKNVSKTETLFKSLIRANLWLRLADRVGLVVTKFPCQNFDELFDGVLAVNWADFFSEDSKIVVEKVSSTKSKLAAERAIQSVTAKAIYSKLCSTWHLNSLRETGLQFSVRLYLENDFAYVVLDTSGEPLHKRGYRLSGGIAPIRETAASLLLQLMRWKRKTPLHDPFCGSGTIPIEATLYAHNVPTGILRDFDFTKFALFEDKCFAQIYYEERAKALAKIQTGNLVRITGSDIDDNAVSLSITNAEKACSLVEAEMRKIGRAEKLVRPEFVQADIAEISAPYDEGLLLGNPLYGERLGDETEAFELYRKIALAIDEFPNWQKAFITNKTEFPEIIREIKHRARFKEHPIKYGKLETVLYEFVN
ncbi:MAG: class I SAM-dependent RNA methyltransferase [Treponemataceae bacterium]